MQKISKADLAGRVTLAQALHDTLTALTDTVERYNDMASQEQRAENLR